MPRSLGELSREQNWGDAGDFRLKSGDFRGRCPLDSILEQLR